MKEKSALILTSISKPNDVMKAFAKGAAKHDIEFIVIGDKSSPPEFKLEGCSYYSLEKQLTLDLEFAKQCPVKHYSRKNIGYLIAIAAGAKIIIESDDDNFPGDKFWLQRHQKQNTYDIQNLNGWINVYGYFSKEIIWPRGLPLEALNNFLPPLKSFEMREVNCPIQQGLADENPDVDAIYRLTRSLPQNFKKGISLSLGNNTWSPFNSQNTTFFKDAFPLLYLPSYCSFRMTDIWRSFIAQRIGWQNGWNILFHSSTVRQKRNDHNLLKDFEDEVPGYLLNAKIADTLNKLKLKKGKKNIAENMIACYAALVEASIIGEKELDLLNCWLNDLANAGYK
jgi:hypothetical protein